MVFTSSLFETVHFLEVPECRSGIDSIYCFFRHFFVFFVQRPFYTVIFESAVIGASDRLLYFKLCPPFCCHLWTHHSNKVTERLYQSRIAVRYLYFWNCVFPTTRATQHVTILDRFSNRKCFSSWLVTAILY